MNGLVGGMPGSETLQRAIHQYRDEERALDIVVVPVDKVAAPAAPDAAALTAFFEERKAEFRTVETRKATLIVASPNDFAAGLTVTEADLKAYYDRLVVSGRFGTPEKRQAQRVLFDTEAEARAAAEKLTAGGTFEAILAEKKLSEKRCRSWPQGCGRNQRCRTPYRDFQRRGRQDQRARQRPLRFCAGAGDEDRAGEGDAVRCRPPADRG